jgi:transcriptional regulator with XRE-family HTH domain
VYWAAGYSVQAAAVHLLQLSVLMSCPIDRPHDRSQQSTIFELRLVPYSNYEYEMIPKLRYHLLGDLIVACRKSKGIALQGQLADLVGASQQSVSRWEAGTSRPRLDQLAVLADALGLDEAVLRREAGYGAPEEALPETVTVSFDQSLPVDALSPESFERFVDRLLRARYPQSTVQRAGKTGHDQSGIDILVIFPDKHQESFQCKRVTRFGPADVDKAVSADETNTERKHLVLSRVASPATAAAVRQHSRWLLWDKEDLSRMVHELPQVDKVRLVDMFFPGQRFALLGIPASGPWQTPDEFFAPFDDRSATFRHSWPLVGRQALVQSITTHLLAGESRVTLLEGRGGEGKSRLLKEITAIISTYAPGCRVLFLSPTETLTATGLEQLGGARKILVVDDAHSRSDLGALFAYAATPANQAGLLLATRPYAATRLREEAGVFALAGEIESIVVKPLTLTESQKLAGEVLEEYGGPKSLALPIAEATRDCPLVTVMAARIAAREEISPAFVQNIREFRDTILGKFAGIITGQYVGVSDQKQVSEILQVIALVQPFSIDDEQFRGLVTSVTGIADHAVSTTLRNLADGGVIFRRGAQFRLMPDVLGDYIIEQSCIGHGDTLNSLADKVFGAAPRPLLGHVLVNLGRLDWRRNGGDPTKSHLLDHLWRALRADGSDPSAVMEAVRSAAFYQPAQALAFVKAQFDAGIVGDELSKILRLVAHHYDYVDDVCWLLWEMGRDDERETGRHPNHAMRVLSEMCEVEPEKPVVHNEKIVEFGISLLADQANFNFHVTPFTFLKSILSGQGDTTSGNARVITFERFLVNYDVVQPLRARVVDAAIAMLSDNDARRAVLAAEFLQSALRYPMDAPEVLQAKYTAEFMGTLRRLNALVRLGKLDPVVLIAIAHAISWHVSFGAHGPDVRAQEIMDNLPQNLEFRTLAALADGWGQIFIDRGDIPTWQARLNTWIAELTADISAAYPDASDLRRFLEASLTRIVNSALAKDNSTHVLIHRILQKRPDLSVEVVRTATDHPDAYLTRELGVALGMVLLTDTNAGRRWARRLLDSNHIPLQIGVAQAYNHPPLGDTGLAQEDLNILVRVLGASNPHVVLTGTGALYGLAQKNPRLAIDMLRHVNFQAHTDVIDRVFMVFHDERSAVLDALTAEDVGFLLSELKPAPVLNGHWVERLISFLSRRFPIQTLQFFMDRVELAVHEDTWGNMQPVNYGPWVNVPTRFGESGQIKVLMEMVWVWMTARTSSDWRFEHNASALFDSVFLPVDEAVIEFLSNKFKSTRKQDLRWVANILGHAHKDFVFEYQNFVTIFLDQCDRAGRPARQKGVEELFRSAISGVRSGIPGQPMPHDLENRRCAAEIMTRLPKRSGAYELYNMILRDAERSIEQARQYAEFFDDE